MMSAPRIWIFVYFVIFCVILSGCRTIHVGGSGGAGGIYGSGGVTIPVPQR